MIPAATVIHHHGIQPEPAHLVLLVLGLALVVLGAFLGGVHIGRTMPDDHDEPIQDASEDEVCGDCEGTGECRHCLGKGVTWVRDPLDGSLVESEDCIDCEGLGICFSCDDAGETDSLRADRYEPRWRNLFGIDPGWTPPEAPTRDEAARAVAEQETT